MPIYEYTCQACGAESEIMQKLSDPPAKECPVCHKKKLVKNISAAGFRLSGGGWYETDFKSDKKKNLAGDKAEKSSSPPDTAASKSDKPSSAPSADAKPAAGTKKESSAKKEPAAKATPSASA